MKRKTASILDEAKSGGAPSEGVSPRGSAVILEPAHNWPEGYTESFAGMPDDFERPPHGQIENRQKPG